MFKIIGLLIFAVIYSSHAKLDLPPELQEYVNDLHKLCLDKGGLQESDHQTYDITNKDKKMMCYMKCLMLESKWMKPDGVIDYDFIEAQSHPDVKDVVMAAVNQCRSISDGADLCEKAYNFNVCLHDADPVNWFFV